MFPQDSDYMAKYSQMTINVTAKKQQISDCVTMRLALVLVN